LATHQQKLFGTGEKIKNLRLTQNLSQENLATKVGITTNYLSLIETNQREASIDVYRCIAKALHVPMWQLFCDLSDEILLIVEDLGNCSETEMRLLRLLFSGNKQAIRQHCRLDY